MINSYSKELVFAKKLAVEANKISIKYYKTSLNTKIKSDNTPVTIADEEINDLVISKVKEAYPDCGVLGEEQSWQKNRQKLWVCDPIDGTIGFSMGEPVFMFSIALVVNGEPVMAVNRELATGRTFWATKGQGAYLDSQRISVSNRSIKQAWLAFTSNLKSLYKYQLLFEKLADVSYQVNAIHGAVFKGMLVAEGFTDGVVHFDSAHPWDFAASKLIVEEAGGLVTDIKGSEQRYDNELDGVIISNGLIHRDLINAINQIDV